MGYALRPGLSYGVIDDHPVFLDLIADRYFRLGKQAEATFRQLGREGWTSAADIQRFLHLNLIQLVEGAREVSPVNVPIAVKGALAMSWDRPAISALAAIIHQCRFERALKARGLAETVAALERQKHRSPLVAQGGGQRERWIRGFEQAKLLRSPVSRCLPRSMALASCLFRSGHAVQLIMGVRLRPFAAHCWVQDGETVLNDTPEQVATFTPVFVL